MSARACWYKSENGWRRGKVLHWSTDHEEYENGPGPIPVGVVEDDETRKCHSVYVGMINFALEKP